MNNPYEQNPFETLRLDPAATNEQVVAQAGRLRQRAAGADEGTAIRQAVQALTGGAAERWVWEVLTHPGACFAWPELDRLRAAFRRPPLPAHEAPHPCPPFDLAEFAGLLRPLVAEQWDTPPLPFAPLDACESAAELQRQNAEARWQFLPEELTA
jgi:hypothetical protein